MRAVEDARSSRITSSPMAGMLTRRRGISLSSRVEVDRRCTSGVRERERVATNMKAAVDIWTRSAAALVKRSATMFPARTNPANSSPTGDVASRRVNASYEPKKTFGRTTVCEGDEIMSVRSIRWPPSVPLVTAVQTFEERLETRGAAIDRRFELEALGGPVSPIAHFSSLHHDIERSGEATFAGDRDPVGRGPYRVTSSRPTNAPPTKTVYP